MAKYLKKEQVETEVEAYQIIKVTINNGTTISVQLDDGNPDFPVTELQTGGRDPKIGDYYVIAPRSHVNMPGRTERVVPADVFNAQYSEVE